MLLLDIYAKQVSLVYGLGLCPPINDREGVEFIKDLVLDFWSHVLRELCDVGEFVADHSFSFLDIILQQS